MPVLHGVKNEYRQLNNLKLLVSVYEYIQTTPMLSLANCNFKPLPGVEIIRDNASPIGSY
jgi:hypothetical protein